MSDAEKKIKETRSRNSKRRNVSGDQSRHGIFLEKSGSPWSSVSVPNVSATSKAQKAKPPAEHQRFPTKQLGLRDCRYFLLGNCKKGKDCPYRHQPSTATMVCKFWLSKKCTNLMCPYLHTENLPLLHDKIPCHFEQCEGGCQKADCDYQHELPRRSDSGVDTEHVAAVSQESESELYPKCSHCGADLSSYALKTGSLMSCLDCALMI